MKRVLRQKNGFSLIEIAIVLLVVGLLSAGVMKGYDLLKQARLRNAATQLTTIRLAYTRFKARFSALPGDWSDARRMFSQTKSGNGNGLLEGHPLTPFSEPSLFWQHLMLSGMLKDMPLFKGDHASLQVGNSAGVLVPESPLGCGLFACTNPDSNLAGTFILLARANDPSKPALTPHDAHALDHILDDGLPLRGNVQARGTPGDRGACIRNGHYNLSHKRAACFLFINLDESF